VIAFPAHRYNGRRQAGKDFAAQIQGVGAAPMGQVAGEEHQLWQGREFTDLRHRPGQGEGLGAPVIAVLEMGVGQKRQAHLRVSRPGRKWPGQPTHGPASRQTQPHLLDEFPPVH